MVDRVHDFMLIVIHFNPSRSFFYEDILLAA